MARKTPVATSFPGGRAWGGGRPRLSFPRPRRLCSPSAVSVTVRGRPRSVRPPSSSPFAGRAPLCWPPEGGRVQGGRWRARDLSGRRVAVGTDVREPCPGVAGFSGGRGAPYKACAAVGDPSGPWGESERRSSPLAPGRGKPSAAGPAGGGAGAAGAASGRALSPAAAGLLGSSAGWEPRAFGCCSVAPRRSRRGSDGQGGSVRGLWVVLVPQGCLGVCAHPPSAASPRASVAPAGAAVAGPPCGVGARPRGAEARAPAPRRRGRC